MSFLMTSLQRSYLKVQVIYLLVVGQIFVLQVDIKQRLMIMIQLD